MKTALFLLSVFAATTLLARTEYIRLDVRTDASEFAVSDEQIELLLGETCTVLKVFPAAASFESNAVRVTFCAETGEAGCQPASFFEPSFGGAQPLVFVGPGIVYLQSFLPEGTEGWAGFKVTRLDNGTEHIPANTIAIPTEPKGDFEIILESSQDLINWNAAEPGTYGSGSERRFFRLRAERKE